MVADKDKRTVKYFHLRKRDAASEIMQFEQREKSKQIPLTANKTFKLEIETLRAQSQVLQASRGCAQFNSLIFHHKDRNWAGVW